MAESVHRSVSELSLYDDVEAVRVLAEALLEPLEKHARSRGTSQAWVALSMARDAETRLNSTAVWLLRDEEAQGVS